MDKDRVKGSAKNIGGKIKEAAGKVTGDEKMKTEGKADQVKGKVQNIAGGVKDTLKGKCRTLSRWKFRLAGSFSRLAFGGGRKPQQG
jgi:uncharacterized protein YjbJ (UPF0337 family)